jgi:hypothetical protein
MPDQFDHIAAQFAADRARRAALVAQAQSWTGATDPDSLGNFDEVDAVPGDQLPNIYARLIALSVQRLRVLSAQLNAAYAEHQVDALVYAKKAYNPGTEELETIGEEPTALARLEGQERDRLEGLITPAVRLQMEVRSREAVAQHGQRIAALAQSMCEEAGLNWASEETRRLAQRAIVRAEAAVVRARG